MCFWNAWFLPNRILIKAVTVLRPIAKSNSRGRILVVEGPLPMHRGVGELVAIVLRLQGFDVRAVFSCDEARAIVSDFEPHAVIIELILDGKLAPALADELKLLRPQMEVLLYGGHPFALELCNKAGKYFALPKPLHPDTILAEIERLLSGRTETYSV